MRNARCKKLEVAELPEVQDDTLRALAKLPKLRKVSARGFAFSDEALSSLGQSKTLNDLRLFDYWTPCDASQYVRDLKKMELNELQTYHLRRMMMHEREAYQFARDGLRTLALTAPYVVQLRKQHALASECKSTRRGALPSSRIERL